MRPTHGKHGLLSRAITVFSSISDKRSMKLCIFTVLLLFSTSSFGARLELPRGGSLSIDEKVWDAQPVELGGEKVVALFHRQHKDLQGFILGGYIREEGACAKKITHKKWVFCRRSAADKKLVNEQIHAQKSVSKTSFQNYIVSFNLPKGKEKDYRLQIDSLMKSFGASP